MAQTLLASVGIIVLSVLCFYRYIIYPRFTSPLAKIPKCTLSCSSYLTLDLMAHKKYGTLIRLAPNELSMNDYKDGVRVAYNSSPDWAKPMWYHNIFSNYGIPTTFTTQESRMHAERRRMINSVFTKSYLSTSQDMRTLSKTYVLDKLLPIIHKSSIDGTSLEILDLMQAFAMDYITAYVYGTMAGSDFLSDIDNRKLWFAKWESAKDYYVHVGEYGPQIKWLQSKLGISIIPTAVNDCFPEFGDWNLSLLKKTEDIGISKDTSAGFTNPVSYNAMLSSLEKAEGSGKQTASSGFSLRKFIASEMLDHTVAGFDTVSIAMTYLMYEMSRKPELQAELRSEVRTLLPPTHFHVRNPNSHEDIPDWRLLDNLPMLNAIVQETLRRWPPAGGALFRMTPKEPTALCGYDNIPAGVRVSANAYTLHRNEEVFPDAESWKPQRWITATKVNEMNKWLWAFGTGARGCVGSNLALMEMKLVTASIYSNYETYITDHGDMEAMDGFSSTPRGRRLNLAFKKIE